MCQQMSARLPCTPFSVRTARSLVSTALEAWGIKSGDVAGDRAADVELAVSELVANAAKFGTRDLGILLVAHHGSVKIAVIDNSPLPARIGQPDPLTPGGRGLALVDALAEKWGQRRCGGHKTVWACVSLPPGSSLVGKCIRASG